MRVIFIAGVVVMAASQRRGLQCVPIFRSRHGEPVRQAQFEVVRRHGASALSTHHAASGFHAVVAGGHGAIGLDQTENAGRHVGGDGQTHLEGKGDCQWVPWRALATGEGSGDAGAGVARGKFGDQRP